MRHKEKSSNKGISEMLTVAEVIKILKISRATLYRMIERGEIRVYKFGRNTRFRHEDIEAFIEAHEKK